MSDASPNHGHDSQTSASLTRRRTQTLNERAPVGGCLLGDVVGRLEIPLVHAMETQRAIRRVLPDPVDLDVIRRCVELGLKGPTAGNDQGWEFLVVTEAATKAKIAARYRKTWPPYAKSLRKKKPGDVGLEKMLRAVQWQVDNFEQIPAVIVPCLRGGRVPFVPVPFIARSSYFGSVYPAVQNILLAARAFGLGANVITGPLFPLRPIRKAIGAPRGVTPVCLIPVGWPQGCYGPTTRVSVDDVLHVDQWG